MRLIKRLSLCFIAYFLLLTAVIAQPLRVAVAANAQFVIKALQADFKKKTGITTEMIIGSSGKLSAQIQNGAPYDVFLSADMDFPNTLFSSGLALNKPKIYALGSLIICSKTISELKNWKQLINNSQTQKIAIANPNLAPYGKAAEQTLKYEKLWDNIKKNIVFGESIAQVNTYINTAVVQFGFTSEAFIHEKSDKENLYWLRINPKTYDQIAQGMVILKHAKEGNYQNALKFYNYLSSAAAKQIFKKSGYQTL